MYMCVLAHVYKYQALYVHVQYHLYTSIHVYMYYMLKSIRTGIRGVVGWTNLVSSLSLLTVQVLYVYTCT